MAVNLFRRDELNRVMVWQLPVRTFHWLHVISIGILGFSGAYIASPFFGAPADATTGYTMGWFRYLHFIAAWIFTVGLVIRVYWLFKGNKYSSWRDWIPTTWERCVFLWDQLKFYVFMTRKHPHYLGHNPIAGLSYFLIVVVIFLQAVTGWALYAEAYTGGAWRFCFGWMLDLFSAQYIRLFHHFLMYVFGAFFLIHIYLCVLFDILERNGLMSSMFSGTKVDKAGKHH